MNNNNVSIHAPTRGATNRQLYIAGYYLFQSTRPHGARLKFLSSLIDLIFVSIHAPTRGATPILSLIGEFIIGFNPRAHTGRDDIKLDRGVYNRVSIHAPTRGATIDGMIYHHTSMFQSTRPHGARLDFIEF